MNLIEIRDLEKIYGLGKIQTPVLKGISLDVKQGEFIAIMGPSGSGKSTLMNIMGFLDVLTSGSYKFDGTKVEDFDEEALADIRSQKIGFVFQHFYLLPRMTALENVKLPMIYAHISDKEQDARATKALSTVDLSHRLYYQPNELSGGQQQRVAIARALVNNPKVIFADEPTGNLDSKSGEQVMNIFKTLNEAGRTIIMVTHEPEIAKRAHRIIHVRDGLLVD